MADTDLDRKDNNNQAEDSAPEITLKPESDPTEPAMTAGFKESELGINAGKTEPLQAAAIDPQVLRNQSDQEKNEFGFDHDAQIKQYNDAMSGAAEGKTNTAASTAAEKEKAEKEKKYKATLENAAMLSAINSINQMSDALDRMQENLDALDQKSQKSAITVSEIEERLSPRIQELEENTKRLEEELEQLKESGASQGEIDSKAQELANSETLLKLYKDTNSTLSQEHQAAQQQMDSARQNMISIRREIEEYKDGNQSPPQELLDRLEEAQQQIKQATESLDRVDSRAKFAEKMLEKTQSIHNEMTMTMAMTCVDPAVIDQQTIELAKHASILEAVLVATEDGVINEKELENLAFLSADANYTQEQVNEFALDIENSGIAIKTKDGMVSGADASSFIMAQYEEIKAEKEAALNQTQNAIDATENKAAALEDTIEQSDQKAQASTEKLIDLTMSDDAMESRAAKLGAASIGDNMSIGFEKVTDLKGNLVAIDLSGDKPAYFAVDKNGEAVMGEDGKPITYTQGSSEYMFFEEKRLAGESGSMSSSVPQSSQFDPLKSVQFGISTPQQSSLIPVFANDLVNNDAYMAKFDQKDAIETRASSEQELASLMSNMDQLKAQENMLVADIAEIDRIQGGVQDGTISIAEAQTQLKQFENDSTEQETQLASSSQDSNEEHLTLDTPDIDPFVADKSINEAQAIIAEAQYNGGTISEEQYEKLAAFPSISENDITKAMDVAGVKIEDPSYNNGLNNVYAGSFTFGSVLDEYGGDPASFAPVKNQTQNAPLASSAFGNAIDPSTQVNTPPISTVEKPQYDPNDPRFQLASNVAM